MKAIAVRIVPVLVAVASLVSVQALAQAKKGAAVPAKGQAAPAPAAAGAKGAQAAPVKPVGPAAPVREVPKLEDIKRDAIVDAKRDEQIDQLKKIIPRIEDGNPQKADLLFQLSENYWEKSRFVYRKEMLKFFEDQRACDEKRDRGEVKDCTMKEDHRESELFRSETMRLYETILREYPSYERKDEVLFNLAYNQYEINKRELAVKRYEELLKSYPQSRFVGDTYVQLGNHYFDYANNLEKARSFYEKAFNDKNPRIKSYALYKLAWCDFNAGSHESALKKLQDTIAFSESNAKGEGGNAFRDLKTQALDDSVRMYIELNRADDAIAYYKQHAGKKKQISLVRKLADGMAGAGHHENAIRSYRYLLDDNAMSESAPDYQQAIVRSFEQLRQRDQVKAEVKKLAELYRPGTTWWKANESKKEVLRNGFNVAEEAMRTTVTEYHQEAQKTKSVDTYRLARDIYRQYVDAFANNDDESFVADQAFNLKFYYAEILWALEDWETAAGQYDGVVSFKIPNRPEAKEASQEKYRQTAAYNALLAYEKLVKIERGLLQKTNLDAAKKIDETAKKGQFEKTQKLVKRRVEELEPKPLTRFEEALVGACDRYNTLFPKNQDEIDVAYAAAVVFYDKNQFVESSRRFGDIIDRYPEEKRSKDAADLSMSVLDEKEEWLELNKLSRRFAANQKLMARDADFAKRTRGIVEGSQYKYVDEVIYKKEKNPKKAAEEFVKFVAEFPKSENADRALTYAMVISREANELDKAIVLGERILREYPMSIFDLKVKGALAFFYEKMARFEDSAKMFENFIATYDMAAGDKAINIANLKDYLKKQKEEEDKRKKEAEKLAKAQKAAAKPAAGKAPAPVAAPSAPVSLTAGPISTLLSKDIKDEAKKKERDAQIEEASKLIADAQYNAGFWWEGVNKLDEALKAYNLYVLRFKDMKDAPEIAFNMCLVQEKAGRPLEALKAYEAFLATYAKDTRVAETRRFDIRYREFLIHRQLKNSAEVDRLAKVLTDAYAKLSKDDQKADRAMLGFAHARFHQLEPQFAGFTAMKFKKFATFKNDRIAKEKKLTELEKAYTEVLASGNPEYGIAALTRIGLLYADFAQSISEIPDPPRLDQDQLDIFRGELESRYVFPVEEKAVEALEKALNKSYEIQVYTEWTTLAQDKLNKYKPGLYAKAKEASPRGSEFFATAPLATTAELPTAQAEKESPAPPPADAPPDQGTGTKPPPSSAAAPTPGAG